jgi:hypothetical protein
MSPQRPPRLPERAGARQGPKESASHRGAKHSFFFKLASFVAFRQQLRPSLDKWPFSGVQNRPPGTPNLPAPKSHGPRPSRGAQSGPGFGPFPLDLLRERARSRGRIAAPGLAAGRGFRGPQGGGFPEADSVPLKAIWQQYRISITYRASWLIRHRNVQGCGI